MSAEVDELWSVAGRLPHVDADSLARAVEAAASRPDTIDYRTRLLIRDSLRALEGHWGAQRFEAWLAQSPRRPDIERSLSPEFMDGGTNEIGFPSLMRNVMDVVRPETIERFFRALSRRVTRPTRLVVGGSIPLILSGLLARATEDVNVVDGVPAELRAQHDVLAELNEVHAALPVALPAGWLEAARPEFRDVRRASGGSRRSLRHLRRETV